MITYTCAFCQIVYNAKYKSKSKTGKQYCSQTCINKDRPPRQLKGVCKRCLKPTHSNKWYCGEECKLKSRPTIEERKEIDKRIRNDTKKRVVVYRQEMKIKAAEYKGGCCQYCGYNKCMGALEFHHLDPKKKDFGIAAVTRSWENIKDELDKCILVCANCHREIHAGMIDVSLTPPERLELPTHDLTERCSTN